MRIHVVQAISFFKDLQVGAIHAAVHHGVATRGGRRAWECRPPLPTDPDPVPLKITRSWRVFPSVTAPNGDLVVTSDVAAQLPLSLAVGQLPCTFEKLVDCFYEKGDFSLYEGPVPGPEDAGEYLARLPRSESKNPVPTYVELLTFYVSGIAPQYPNARSVTVRRGPPSHNCADDVLLCAEMFRDYPHFSSSAGELMTEEVFAVIRKHVDPDFFYIASLEID